MGPWDAFNEGFSTSYNSALNRRIYDSPEEKLFKLYKKNPQEFSAYYQAKHPGPNLEQMLASMMGIPMQGGGMGGAPGGMPGAPGQGGAQLSPGEIMVRDKRTGQMGALPAAEFNPQLYDRI